MVSPQEEAKELTKACRLQRVAKEGEMLRENQVSN